MERKKDNYVLDKIVKLVLEKLYFKRQPEILKKGEKCPICGKEMGKSEARFGCEHYDLYDLETPTFRKK